MKTVGFIGFGKMNQMLARGFLDTGILDPGQVVISTRTREKTTDLIAAFPGVRLLGSNRELAGAADLIIIGVRPLDVPGILTGIRDVKEGDVHIISIAGCVRIEEMIRIHPGRISRLFPSLCSTVGEGISLCCHHDAVNPDEARFVEELFSSISRVMVIEEELFEPAGDMMSCGPALITKMLMEFADAGARHSTLDLEICRQMVLATAFGTALMLQEGMQAEDLISRVATPGGITEEGVKILERGLPPIFDLLFDTTLAKHEKIREMVAACCTDQPDRK